MPAFQSSPQPPAPTKEKETTFRGTGLLIGVYDISRLAVIWEGSLVAPGNSCHEVVLVQLHYSVNVGSCSQVDLAAYGCLNHLQGGLGQNLLNAGQHDVLLNCPLQQE